MLLWAACGPQTVVCPPCHEVTVAVTKELEMQSKFFLVGNNVLYANKKFQKSPSFQPDLSMHCLAVLDLQARLEQPFNCRIISSRTIRTAQSMRRSMDWTDKIGCFGRYRYIGETQILANISVYLYLLA